MERLTHHRKSDGAVCPNCTRKDIETRWGEVVQEIADKLCAYENAEEHGLLVRLPCKVDDTFWWVERLVGDDKPFIRSGQVSEIGISDAITIYEYDGRDFSVEDVYFTREEAEAALAKETNASSKGENNG